jgi:hypothetical protein
MPWPEAAAISAGGSFERTAYSMRGSPHIEARIWMRARQEQAYPAPVRTEPLRLVVERGETVSAILLAPDRIVAAYVLATEPGQE